MYGRVCHVCSIGCLPVVIALGVAGLTGDLQVYGRVCHVCSIGCFLVVIALVVVAFFVAIALVAVEFLA